MKCVQSRLINSISFDVHKIIFKETETDLMSLVQNVLLLVYKTYEFEFQKSFYYH